MPLPLNPPLWLRRLVQTLAWLLLVLGLCLGAAWAALHAWIVPRIADFRPALERLATQAVGRPVRVGDIAAQSTGWAPSFELRDIRLQDAQGQTVLALPRVLVAISVRSALQLGLEQLVIDQPVLQVQQRAAGQWSVAGFEWSGQASQDLAALDWLLHQREVLVRGGTVQWQHSTADDGATPPLTWRDVDLVLRNGVRQHQWRLDATPPAHWGERWVLMGQFQRGVLSTRPSQWSDWHGQVFAQVPRLDLAPLRPWAPLGLDLRSGQGRLRLWADLAHGQWQGGAVDMDLQNLALRLRPDLPLLQFKQLSGRLSGHHDPQSWSLATDQLQWEDEQGLRWQGGAVRVNHSQAAAARGRTEVQAEQLDLGTLRESALRLPLPAVWREALQQHRVDGQLQRLRLQWEGPPEAAQALQGQLQVEQLQWEAAPGHTSPWPGGRGLKLALQFGAEGGQAQLEVGAGGHLRLPGVWEDEQLPLQHLQAQARWKAQGGGWSVPQWSVQLRNDDLRGQASGQWQPAAGSRWGVLDLQGQIDSARADRVHRYLPKALPEKVRHYVRESIRGGQVQALQVRIKGDLDKLPMPQPGDGEFRFSGQLKGVDMAYVPAPWLAPGQLPWPALREIDGTLVFERQGMGLNASSARLGEARTPVTLSHLKASIPDLRQNATLSVSADLQGPATHVLRAIQTSAVDALLEQALTQAKASGNLQGQLALQIPLLNPRATQVQGKVVLGGNDLTLSSAMPTLERTQGTVQFTEKGFALQGMQARLLGGTSRFEGGLRSGPVPAGETPLWIRAQGVVTADGLRNARALQPLDQLGKNARGQTPYSASLGWREGQPELQVRSSLEGLELLLPPPLGKRAPQAWPLLIAGRVLAGGAAPRDQLRVELGSVLQATYVRDLSGPVPRALRGSLALGSATPAPALPSAGVVAAIQLELLPIDAWQEAWGGQDSLADEPQAPWASYLPQRVSLRAERVQAQGRTLQQLQANITREGATWRAQIDARELQGQAQYTPGARQQPGRLYARLARLNLPPSAISEVESLLHAPPSSMPALDIEIEDLTLRGKRLGQVSIEAVNVDARGARGAGRDWRLERLNITVPEATLRANGLWSSPSEGRARRTDLNFRLELRDAGALLERLGTPGALRGGAGQMEGQLRWSGSPMELHYPSLEGQFQVRLGRGQFLKADPGVAKLLGVLSLQGLPRRLLLDFRDVFAEGFAFDGMQGAVRVQQGVASTRDLEIRGVNALVRMEGSADLARETQQLQVLILPQLDAGGASVVAGFAVNPAVGLTAYLTQWLLKKPLSKATAQVFSVDGSWSEPRVTRLDAPRPTAPATAP